MIKVKQEKNEVRRMVPLIEKLVWPLPKIKEEVKEEVFEQSTKKEADYEGITVKQENNNHNLFGDVLKETIDMDNIKLEDVHNEDIKEVTTEYLPDKNSVKSEDDVKLLEEISFKNSNSSHTTYSKKRIEQIQVKKTRKKTHTCSECEYKSTDQISLVRHAKRVHDVGTELFTCSFCKKSYNWRYQLQRHLAVHSVDKPFTCSTCEKSFALKSYLRAHQQKTHSEERPFSCKICGKTFSLRAYLNHHQRSRHQDKKAGLRLFPCPLCKEKLPHKTALIKHHRRAHLGVKDFVCPVCKKTFNHRSHFINHHRIHTGERPFKCYDCKKTFGRKYHLVSHQRTHTDIPSECLYCKQVFPQKSCLVDHLRRRHREISFREKVKVENYSGEDTFTCADCGKTFAKKASLSQHVIAHFEGRHFKCNVCKKAFRHNRSLLFHQRKHSKV